MSRQRKKDTLYRETQKGRQNSCWKKCKQGDSGAKPIKNLKKKNCQSRVPYSVKVSFNIKEQYRLFGHVNAPRVHLQQTATRRNMKRNPPAEGNAARWKYGGQRKKSKKALL